MALQPLWTLAAFSVYLPTLGRPPGAGDQAVSRPVHIYGATQTQTKCTQKSIALVGFEPLIPAFERAKTVHALDLAATVTGR
jgi:hypothetical protein